MRVIVTLFLSLCCAALTECQRRRIDKLPRINFQPNFTQYSGYLTSTDDRRLFYWLVESSEVTPRDAPLILWLNGGPGCSSVGGLLMTNGPFLANDRAELDQNELAWNRLANMLYIDSPNGVGLSEPGPINTAVLNDNYTTELNLRALLHFFTLFPEFHGRPFYMAGESYAGIYIPLLSQAILRSNHFPNLINLKGIAIGNGLHVPANHSVLTEARKEFGDIMGMTFEDDTAYRSNLSINLYNVVQPCYQQDSVNVYPCMNSTGLMTYLRDKQVRVALGVLDTVPSKYDICNLIEIFDNYHYLDRDVLSEFQTIISAKISILLYHGNLDYMIPTRVTQRLLKRLPPNVTEDVGAEGAWFYCYRQFGRVSKQIGGVQKSYMGGLLRHRTVIGAGHSVVTDRPEAGYQIFLDFLKPDNSLKKCPEFRSDAAKSGSHRVKALGLPWMLMLLSVVAIGAFLR